MIPVNILLVNYMVLKYFSIYYLFFLLKTINFSLCNLKNYQRRYIQIMLIIDSKDCENIDKALKKYKKVWKGQRLCCNSVNVNTLPNLL